MCMYMLGGEMRSWTNCFFLWHTFSSEKEKQKMSTQTTDNLKSLIITIWVHRPSIKGTKPPFIVIKAIIIIIGDRKKNLSNASRTFTSVFAWADILKKISVNQEVRAEVRDLENMRAWEYSLSETVQPIGDSWEYSLLETGKHERTAYQRQEMSSWQEI